MKIALDVMGYENDISEAIIAARKFVKKYHDVKIILVGDKDKINPLIQEGEFEVFHASEVLTMEESALTALRRTNTSMFQAIKLVADNKADGVLSAGSTVGFISLSYFILKSIPGISKPAFMPYMPTVNKKGVMLIDVGANKTCTGEDLHQFAIMADISAEELEKLEQEFRSDTCNIRQSKEFVSPDELFNDLLESIRKYHPSADLSLVEKAYKVAYDAHKGQVRKSGEPYIMHPLCVAIILADLELDKETIAAGLLHDVLEDTVMTDEEMKGLHLLVFLQFLILYVRKFLLLLRNVWMLVFK